MALSAEQKLAVETFDRNILLLASAGTGKTFTVANKVAEALKRGISPKEILCLTFTVKAQEEITNDILAYSGETGVNCFTIHGFCYRLIKDCLSKSGDGSFLAVADDVDAGETLKTLADGMIAEKTDDKDALTKMPDRNFARIMSEIKREKDELGFSYSSDDGYGVALASLFKKSGFDDMFNYRLPGAQATDYNFYKLLRSRGKEFCIRYSEILKSSNLVDYDDLLYRAKEFIQNGEVDLNAYKLIITDEVQDTNMLEYRIIERFFGNAEVMLCGDENQTIYGWRGSAPKEIINDFRTKYNPLEIRLTKNRRTTKLLTCAAQGFLENAFGGNYKPETTEIPQGEKITVLKCLSPRDEAEKIYNEIADYAGDRTEICVMARSNRYVAQLYRHLSRINSTKNVTERIPFFTADSDQQFYKKPLIKDFLAFLRLAVNPNDVSSLERICKRYLKSIKTDLVSAIDGYGSAGLSVSAFMRDETYAHGDPFFTLIKAYGESSVVVYDLETTGANPYDDYPIQISAVKLGKAGITDKFDVFVIPEKEISAGALATHGYDEEYIKTHGGISLRQAIERFSIFSQDCVLVGHNSAAFDDIMLGKAAQAVDEQIFATGYYDTLSIAKTFFKSEKNYKLSTLCEKFGIVNERAHDAFADVSATASILAILLDDYIIPSAAIRKNLIASNASAFRGFYGDMSRFKAEITTGDVRGAIKDIAACYGLINEQSKKDDRESANELYVSLKSIESAPRPEKALEELLASVALSGSQLDLAIKKLKKVPILTIHQSKGCEFEEVIFAGVAENEIPSVPAMQSGNEEEEKRVFYVALTRAKKKLILTYSSTKSFGYNEYERLPSPYVAFIPEEYISR